MLWKDAPWKPFKHATAELEGTVEAEIALPGNRQLNLIQWSDGDLWITLYEVRYEFGEKRLRILEQKTDLDPLEAQCLLNHYLQG